MSSDIATLLKHNESHETDDEDYSEDTEETFRDKIKSNKNALGYIKAAFRERF